MTNRYFFKCVKCKAEASVGFVPQRPKELLCDKCFAARDRARKHGLTVEELGAIVKSNASYARAQQPYSPAELRNSCACGAVFDLEKIESLINQKEESYRKSLGLLPKTCTVIPYWPNAHEHFQPILIVDWK
jgi:hypothetical protein